MAAYATRQDIFRYALARGALASGGRLADSVSGATDTFELDSHGFVDDDQVTARVAEGGTLPAPLVEGTVYFVIRVTDSTFKLSATAGGGAINLTEDGESVIVTQELPYDEVLEAVSRWIDGFLPAHLVPDTAPFPIVLTDAAARLAAARLQALSGVDSAIVRAAEEQVQKQLERWLKGQPIRDANAGPKTNLAIKGSATSGDPGSGSSSGGGTIP